MNVRLTRSKRPDTLFPDTALFRSAYTIPDGPVIGGRIHDRGGLYVDPECRGDRLSWFLTGLQWAVALSEGVDHVVSQTLPKVGATVLDRKRTRLNSSH